MIDGKVCNALTETSSAQKCYICGATPQMNDDSKESVTRSVDCVRTLCRTADIICLQELWLLQEDIPYLSSIDPEFGFTGKSAVDTGAGILRGRPFGGVGVLWRKSLFTSVSVVQCKSVRIAAIKIVLSDRSLLVFSVYMPTDSADNLMEFTECLGELAAIVEECQIDSVFILGDFNAHPDRRFGRELLDFCAEQKWQCADMEILGAGSASYTYVSDINGTRSWLDHCVVSEAACKSTNKLSPRSGLPVSVDGVSETDQIAQLFKQHFQVESPLAASEEPLPVRRAATAPPVIITAKKVARLVRGMTRGKSPGHDYLSIEHLQHAGVHLPRVLAMLFTFCVGHTYLPEDMMKTVVVPIIKNRTGDASDMGNYRPISLATIVAKVLDSVLDEELDSHIKLNDAQFGFRPGLSTETAVLCLKHTVRYYTDRKTPVFACFLDLSKAFDLIWCPMVNYGRSCTKTQHCLVSWWSCSGSGMVTRQML
ncbi:uncharacterized protein LOC113239015 [Hyposmocoma kahamanoa]|uniref:uncharacterized protein LOC113239015 n=1 Tax=Hyposmocoma kahamanoa TaxID=1477025 RepID=UPI000E6D7140|nr:uncharacterized protein LOC113239015 [Hyposmocoma kahamanoa]